MAIKINNDIVIYDDKVFKVAAGDNAARPLTPAQGMIRYNTQSQTFEGYSGTAWNPIGGGASKGLGIVLAMVFG